MNSIPLDYNVFCANWLNAWTGNNPLGLLKYYTENAFYSDPLHPAGLKGHAQINAYFTKLLLRNPEWKWSVEEIFPTTKGFTLKWKAVMPVKNTLLTTYGLDIVELDGNRISRNEVYFDRSPWLEIIMK